MTRKPPPPAIHNTIDMLAVLTADVHPPVRPQPEGEAS